MSAYRILGPGVLSDQLLKCSRTWLNFRVRRATALIVQIALRQSGKAAPLARGPAH